MEFSTNFLSLPFWPFFYFLIFLSKIKDFKGLKSLKSNCLAFYFIILTLSKSDIRLKLGKKF